MLSFLFRRLTAEPETCAGLFEAVTAEARQPHWYVEGEVPDTLDGRFAVLATVMALVLVRLEAGERGNAMSVALTERFIHVMESEHRELGLGDPTLGKTVRRLVGSLARRVELWRSAVSDGDDWTQAARASIYAATVDPGALEHVNSELKGLWIELESADLDVLSQGKLR